MSFFTNAIFVISALLIARSAADICAGYTSCLDCAGVNGCGWCSNPITFPNGQSGPQCASPSSSGQFSCSGIYSTSSCIQGYLCDQAAGACRLAGPGQGTTFDVCNAACTVGPAAAVYGCVNGSHSCVEVPPGTPGSGSMAECEKQCIQPPALVYKCSEATQQCVVVPSGTPGSASYEVCVAIGCDSGTWGCDLSTYDCVRGTGQMSNASCTVNCRATNDPCSPYKTCPTCLAAGPECGWCSENVTYASGQQGGQCAGVGKTILPFQCKGIFSTTSCSATPAPGPTPQPTPSPYIPPGVPCPPGSMVLLQYNCVDANCNGCNTGPAELCTEPHCTYYCSGKCQPVTFYGTSFMWSCNGDPTTGLWTNATLVHFLKTTDCTGPVNPPGTGGSGTYPLDQCGSPYGPNFPPQYNTFMCVPCGDSCS